MQTDEVEFELPGVLDTPSLLTPNFVLNAPPMKLHFNPTYANASNNNNNEILSSSNPSSIKTTETSSSVSSADVKVSLIEDELKQSLSEARRPTPSPFQKISSNNIFLLDKPTNVITTDDGTTIEIPSTADVVKELEAITNTNSLDFPTKTSINDNNERETTATMINGDNIRYDSPPTLNMGVIVSPKKKFLIRSQSHTEPTLPIPNNNLSQSQKSNNDNSILNIQNGLDEENSMDDSVDNQFTRVADLSTIAHPSDNNNQQFKPTIDNGNEQHLSIQLRPDQNGILHPVLKQQTIVTNNKRTFQQTNTGNNNSSMIKASTIIIPQPPSNEVTSTEHLSTAKRQRTNSIPINTTSINFHTSAAIPAVMPTNTSPTNGINATGGSEDIRKKQIRDSNREAARRCRERRRQYIEQLEGNLEQHKAQIKQLSEKLARVERENTQLRAILSETKILHPASRLSLNESHVDFTNVITATGVDINSDTNQTDGGTIQRSYINRNNL